MIVAVIPPRRHHPAVLGVEIALLRSGKRMLIPRMPPVNRISESVLRNEYVVVLPIIVIGTPQKDPDPKVDLHEIGGEKLSVHDNSGSHKRFSSPIAHVSVIKSAVLRILKTSPAAEQDSPLTHFLVAR